METHSLALLEIIVLLVFTREEATAQWGICASALFCKPVTHAQGLRAQLTGNDGDAQLLAYIQDPIL
jgi:hypothetical protein